MVPMARVPAKAPVTAVAAILLARVCRVICISKVERDPAGSREMEAGRAPTAFHLTLSECGAPAAAKVAI